MKRKVLFTASSYSHIEHFHLPYLRELQALGWETHIVGANAPPSAPFADRSIDLPFNKRQNFLENLRTASKLRRLIRAEGYDFVVAHTTLASFFTRLAVMGMRNRPKLAYMSHGYLFCQYTPAWKSLILRTAERFAAPVTDLLLTMNEYDYDVAKRCRWGRRVVKVPGVGVDFSRFTLRGEGASLRAEYGIPQDAFVLIYAAEFSGRKSQSVLIEAMKLLPERVVLVLPGDGVLLEDCKTLASSLGLENRVIFPGYITEMPGWYRMADAAVTASRSEGLPFNVMEAMYMGLPVVASRTKGHVDLIQDGETGLLYPYGDVSACAARIMQVVEDAALREKLSRNARESAAQYGLDRVLPLVMEQYAQAGVALTEEPAET